MESMVLWYSKFLTQKKNSKMMVPKLQKDQAVWKLKKMPDSQISTDKENEKLLRGMFKNSKIPSRFVLDRYP